MVDVDVVPESLFLPERYGDAVGGDAAAADDDDVGNPGGACGVDGGAGGGAGEVDGAEGHGEVGAAGGVVREGAEGVLAGGADVDDEAAVRAPERGEGGGRERGRGERGARGREERGAAEGVVVEGRGVAYRGRVAARGARALAAADARDAERVREAVDEDHARREGRADAARELERLDGLEAADDPNRRAEHAGRVGLLHARRGGRHRVQAPVAPRHAVAEKDTHLALAAERGAGDERAPGGAARVAQDVARGDAVGRVDDDVVLRDRRERRRGRDARGDRRHAHVRVQRAHRRRRAQRLVHALGGRAVDHLPVQVARLHHVPVRDAQPAHARARQVQDRRAPEPARAHHQHARAPQPRLARRPKARQRHLPRVPRDVRLAQPAVPEADLVALLGGRRRAARLRRRTQRRVLAAQRRILRAQTRKLVALVRLVHCFLCNCTGVTRAFHPLLVLSKTVNRCIAKRKGAKCEKIWKRDDANEICSCCSPVGCAIGS